MNSPYGDAGQTSYLNASGIPAPFSNPPPASAPGQIPQMPPIAFPTMSGMGQMGQMPKTGPVWGQNPNLGMNPMLPRQ